MARASPPAEWPGAQQRRRALSGGRQPSRLPQMRVGNSCAVLVVSLPKSRKPADEGGVGGARNSTAILQEARYASFAAAPGPPCGVRSPMSMEHIVNKMWKHK